MLSGRGTNTCLVALQAFFVFLELDHLATTQGINFSILTIMLNLKQNCLVTMLLDPNISFEFVPISIPRVRKLPYYTSSQKLWAALKIVLIN